MLDQTDALYFPKAHPDWERVSPQQAGFDPDKLQAAVDKAHEIDSPWSRDLERPLDDMMHEPPPYNEKIGPLKARGDHSGLILRGGRIAAEWGTPDRVDMTFSATKSYLALCLGLAWDRGLIPDFDAPVRELVDDGGFEPPHNDAITWRMLFQQTSEWSGELWGKPDWLDHNRFSDQKGTKREMNAPGTHWEYNDVRVNRASLALLRVWKRPLPEVLKEYIMDPIGASDSWEWHGYRNSYVTIDGREMQSVSGGGHWGGGMFINAFDHARIGQLLLRRGEWNGQRLISEAFLDEALAPCPKNPNYGFMFWLNGPQEQGPSAPANSFFLRGAGSHVVWIDPEHDLVTVLRWIDKERADAVYSRVLAALD
jgi:CubicO group peptidase (beta-lactamase class C family)